MRLKDTVVRTTSPFVQCITLATCLVVFASPATAEGEQEPTIAETLRYINDVLNTQCSTKGIPSTDRAECRVELKPGGIIQYSRIYYADGIAARYGKRYDNFRRIMFPAARIDTGEGKVYYHDGGAYFQCLERESCVSNGVAGLDEWDNWRPDEHYDSGRIELDGDYTIGQRFANALDHLIRKVTAEISMHDPADPFARRRKPGDIR